MLVATLIVLTLVTIVAAVFLLGKQKLASPKAPTPSPSPSPQPKNKPAKVDITKRNSTSAPAARKASDVDTPISEHALVYRHLRGHQGDITGVSVSPNGRQIASVATDGQLRLWTVVDNVPNTAFARLNFKKGDYGTAVSLSGQYVTVAMAELNMVQIFSITTDAKAGTSTLTFQHSFRTPHKAHITTIRMASNQQSIVTMAEGSTDLNVHVFNTKGSIIATLPVAQLVNYSFALSDDARFLAACTKIDTPKVFELIYKKEYTGAASSTPSSGAPEKVDLLTVLKGHKRGVKSLAFGSPASGLIVSASSDGAFAEHTMKYADVREKVGAPKLRRRVQTEFESLSHIDVTHFADEDTPPVVVIAAGTTLQFWKSTVGEDGTPEILATVHAPHKGNITALEFNKENSSFLVTAGENKSITIWKVPQ